MHPLVNDLPGERLANLTNVELQTLYLMYSDVMWLEEIFHTDHRIDLLRRADYVSFDLAEMLADDYVSEAYRKRRKGRRRVDA